MTVAESLKKIRKQYKMTQEDIATLLGISRSGYTYYETGKTLPSIDVLQKLAVMYNTTIDTVVGNPAKKSQLGNYNESMFVAESNVDPLMCMKKDEQALIMAFRLLENQEKDKLKEIAIEMLKKHQESEN